MVSPAFPGLRMALPFQKATFTMTAAVSVYKTTLRAASKRCCLPQLTDNVNVTTTVKITVQLLLLLTFLTVTVFLLVFHASNETERNGKDDQACLTSEMFALNLDRVCVRRGKWSENTDVARNGSVIPKRLHQTFNGENIPEVYHKSIRSWLEHHPDWEYYFWTASDAERMIRERYPQYTTLIQNYQQPLLKSDVIRYFILHQYGGIYTDMDVQSLKPIETFLKTNSCVLVQEPRVQTRMIFNHSYSLTSCILASVPNHPFFDFILRRLNSSNRPVINHNSDIIRATGPFFLNETYNQYVRKFPDCRNPGSYCNAYVADSKYLVPTFDLESVAGAAMKCRKNDPSALGYYNILACQELMNSKFVNTVPEEAYTNHLWLHIGWFPKDELKTRHITEIVLKAIRYDQPGI